MKNCKGGDEAEKKDRLKTIVHPEAMTHVLSWFDRLTTNGIHKHVKEGYQHV